MLARIGAIFLLLCFSCAAQTANPSPISTSDIERITGAAMTRGGAMQFLETLTDQVGGRVFASPESKIASELILNTLRQSGFENAHYEEFPVATGWTRGPIHGRVIAPVTRPIFVGAYGWVPGTEGAVHVPLMEVIARPDGTFSKDLKGFRGEAVIVDFETGNTLTYASNYIALRTRAIKALAQNGAVAMLIPSDKPHRLLYTSAFGMYPGAPIPVLSLGREDRMYLHRLLAKGPVQLELDVKNTFDKNPSRERNIVAEIRGSDPAQVVLVGAHFDSWDPAQGANDNGSGVAAVLEAARILKSIGVKPKATIRFVFFSGEEPGCLGSRAYVREHRGELGAHRAVLIMDGGAQLPVGFELHGRNDLTDAIRPLLSVLQPFGADQPIPEGDIGSDEESFIVQGVPAFTLATEPGDYDVNHHAVTDTLDKVDPRWLAMDTAVMALAAYSVANSENAPGKRLSAPEIMDLLTRTRQLDGIRVNYGPDWKPE